MAVDPGNVYIDRTLRFGKYILGGRARRCEAIYSSRQPSTQGVRLGEEAL